MGSARSGGAPPIPRRGDPPEEVVSRLHHALSGTDTGMTSLREAERAGNPAPRGGPGHRPPPVLSARCSIVTLLALRRSHGGPMPVEATAWYHQPESTFGDGPALVRRHLWRSRYVVTAAADPEFVPFPRTAFERWPTAHPFAV
jgi:hypothetical protein